MTLTRNVPWNGLINADGTMKAGPELKAAFQAAGLAAESWFGDWDRTPFTGDDREVIVVGRKAG